MCSRGVAVGHARHDIAVPAFEAAEPRSKSSGRHEHRCAPADRAVQVQRQTIGLERAGTPQEVARVVGFLASGFSSYVTGANMIVDGSSSVINPLTIPM